MKTSNHIFCWGIENRETGELMLTDRHIPLLFSLRKLARNNILWCGKCEEERAVEVRIEKIGGKK